MTAKLIESTQVIDMTGIGSVDLDTDPTLDYVNVKDYRRGLLIFLDGVGTAGDDWNLTITQANTAAGGGVKDADIIDSYKIKQAATNLLATAEFTTVAQTADALIDGDGTSAEEVCTVVADLDFSRLDTNNGFHYIGGTVVLAASGGAQYGNVVLILYDPRYAQVTTPGALA